MQRLLLLTAVFVFLVSAAEPPRPERFTMLIDMAPSSDSAYHYLPHQWRDAYLTQVFITDESGTVSLRERLVVPPGKSAEKTVREDGLTVRIASEMDARRIVTEVVIQRGDEVLTRQRASTRL